MLPDSLLSQEGRGRSSIAIEPTTTPRELTPATSEPSKEFFVRRLLSMTFGHSEEDSRPAKRPTKGATRAPILDAADVSADARPAAARMGDGIIIATSAPESDDEG